VKEGQRIAAGRKLGEVGYSGDAAFPPCALIDPLLPDHSAACEIGGKALWSASALSALAYRPVTLLALGLAARAITLEELEAGAPLVAPSRDTPVVAYMWGINLQKSDIVDIEIRYGSKVVAKNSKRLERNRSQFMLFAGKKSPPGGWSEGTYTSAVEVIRDGRSVVKESHSRVVK
jgi:hypothetical protein